MLPDSIGFQSLEELPSYLLNRRWKVPFYSLNIHESFSDVIIRVLIRMICRLNHHLHDSGCLWTLIIR